MRGRSAACSHRATIAACLLVSFCAGLLVMPHADCLDDFACNPVFIVHDESSHQIGASPSAQNEVQHCYLCHWSRSSYSLSPAVAHAAWVDRVEHVRATSATAPGRIEWSLIPGRAPPA